MKKLLTLLLAAGMFFSAANKAPAVEMQVSGEWDTSFTFVDNLFGKNALSEDRSLEDGSRGTFNAASRVRLNMDLVASESVSARLQWQTSSDDERLNQYSWGQAGAGGKGEKVTARLAYVDWMIPNSDVMVRMGRQEVALPSFTFSSGVLDDVTDGVVVSSAFNDAAGMTAGWLRPAAAMEKWGLEHHPHNSVDLFYLGVDFRTDSLHLSPWGMVGWHGNGHSVISEGKDELGNPVQTVSTVGPGPMDMMGYASMDESNTLVYWAGIGGEIRLSDLLRLTGDFVYSANDGDAYAEREGWYAALGVEMNASFAKPFLRSWYASGDDADSRGSQRLMSVDGAAAFDASSIYFDANGMLGSTIDICNPAGTWGVQFGVHDLQFVEALNHSLSLTYFKGTNNTNRITDPARRAMLGDLANPVTYLTTKDSAWEVDFMSSYEMYRNLSVNMLLAYMVTDFDADIWGADYEDAFRGTLNFNYSF